MQVKTKEYYARRSWNLVYLQFRAGKRKGLASVEQSRAESVSELLPGFFPS